jgi:hypothetical protein
LRNFFKGEKTIAGSKANNYWVENEVAAPLDAPIAGQRGHLFDIHHHAASVSLARLYS